MDKQYSTIGVIVAMDKELAQLRTLLTAPVEQTVGGQHFIVGTIGDKRIVMQKCGIGKVNSAVGAVEMINNYHPDLVVSSGCAGGADTSLEVADVVVSTACCYHDAYCGEEVKLGQILGMPAEYASPSPLVEKAATLNCGVRVAAGQIVSGEWFVDSREKMGDILSHFPQAKAVDMESCSIAQTCHIYGVDFISFRIISDIPLKDTKAEMYYNFWEKIAEGSFEVTKQFLESVKSEA